MGKTQTTQQELLRQAREKLKVSNTELAKMLGKSEAGLLAWLSPSTSKKFRTMPEIWRDRLASILAEHRAKAKRR